MRLSVAVPAVVLILALAGLVTGLTVGGQAAAERRRLEAIPRTGLAILDAHTCRRGETKQILVLGVEDGFSPAGAEPGFIRPGRNTARFLPRSGTGEYDQVNADHGFTDSFRVEGPVAGGLLVIGARSLNGSDNDTIGFGTLGRDPADSPGVWVADGPITNPQSARTWSVEGEVFHAKLDEVEMRDLHEAEERGRRVVQSLTSYLNGQAGGGWLDVFVQDDTAIDFMGLALCRPPEMEKGVTLTSHPLAGPQHRGLIHLSCHNVRDPDQRCDPYVGDTVCSRALPVACIRPGNLPSPVDAAGRAVTGAWSGGEIGLTEPVPGDRFRTVQEVDALCTRRLGQGWRVLALQDGYRNQSVSGRGDPAGVAVRVWADIADQPYATCWARR